MKNNLSFNSQLSKFGIGLFETIKIKNGQAISLNLHLDRIFKSINELNLNVTEDRGFIEKKIIEYIKYEKINNKALRLTIFDEGYNLSTRDIIYDDSLYKRGFNLCISPIVRGDSIIYRHKTTNYFENIYSKNFALKNGYDDSIFIDFQNRILECSMSNIYFIKDNKIYTPNKKLPILNGTMKKRIIDICLDLEIDIKQCDIKIEDIEEFEFCFISNSLMGLMKVNKIEKIKFKSCNNIFEQLWRIVNE